MVEHSVTFSQRTNIGSTVPKVNARNVTQKESRLLRDGSKNHCGSHGFEREERASKKMLKFHTMPGTIMILIVDLHTIVVVV